MNEAGPHTLASLRARPNSLAAHYQAFRVGERGLLTGHSHQAWPDVARTGVVAAFDDAADLVDGKWSRAFAKAERVRAGYRRLLDDPDGHITLCGNTHDAVVRFLSALPLEARPRLLSTDGEFHTLRRQLDRLADGVPGIVVDRVPMAPTGSVCERLTAALNQRPDATAAVLLSTVTFGGAELVGGAPGLPGADAFTALQQACDRAGAALFLDVYHHLNVVPFSVQALGLHNAFITGGGYKYCQLGEGNGFLRFPRGSALRPIVTGWFAEFGLLPNASATGGTVVYLDGADRFAGATYDPTSHYRGAAVFDFFAREGLDVSLLRSVSQHQVGRLARGFDALGLDPHFIDRDRSLPDERRAGFLALRTAVAARFVSELAARGIAVDARGETLRLGPAPYLCDDQLDAAIAAVGEVAREIG
ncbi:MAG TPA: kynureninase [Polyangia bacterium]